MNIPLTIANGICAEELCMFAPFAFRFLGIGKVANFEEESEKEVD